MACSRWYGDLSSLVHFSLSCRVRFFHSPLPTPKQSNRKRGVDSRYLTIHLFYTEDCPTEYEPEGFQRCEDHSVLFPEGPDLLKQTTSCGQLDTGSHWYVQTSFTA